MYNFYVFFPNWIVYLFLSSVEEGIDVFVLKIKKKMKRLKNFIWEPSKQIILDYCVFINICEYQFSWIK